MNSPMAGKWRYRRNDRVICTGYKRNGGGEEGSGDGQGAHGAEEKELSPRIGPEGRR